MSFISSQCQDNKADISKEATKVEDANIPEELKQPELESEITTASGAKVTYKSEFIIESPSEYTNDSSPEASWTRKLKSKQYDVFISLEEKCLTPIKSWPDLNENTIKIEGLADGTYYFCAQVVLQNGEGPEWAKIILLNSLLIPYRLSRGRSPV